MKTIAITKLCHRRGNSRIARLRCVEDAAPYKKLLYNYFVINLQKREGTETLPNKICFIIRADDIRPYIVIFNYSALPYFSARFATSSARILLCSLSGKAYLKVGIAERSIPIAGGTEIRKNIAAANLPSL